MAATENTITTEDINFSLDREFIENFKGESDRLAEILGIFDVETIAAGTTLYQTTVTGSLNKDTRAEGEEIPLSKYEVSKDPVASVKPVFYRKRTTAEAVLQSGYEKACVRTDQKMLFNVRGDIISQFFTFLGTGTGTATGSTLQETLAKMDATLADTMETNGDEAAATVHFINRQDAAAYLGAQPITTQTVFGMTYLENFLGIERVFLTNKVASGAPVVTPATNVHIFGVDVASLSRMGLSYEQESNGLVGVHHEALYGCASGETHVITGMTLFPECKDYIVKGTVSPQ